MSIMRSASSSTTNDTRSRYVLRLCRVVDEAAGGGDHDVHAGPQGAALLPACSSRPPRWLLGCWALIC